MRALAVVVSLLVACKSGNRGPRLEIVYELDVGKAVDDRAAELRRDLEAAFIEERIVATVRTPVTPPGALTITLADGTKQPAIEQLLKSSYGDTVERRACDAADGSFVICIQISAAYATALEKSALSAAVGTIRTRLLAMGYKDPTVVERAGQIVVELPSTVEQAEPIRSVVARTGKLEFKVVDDNSAYMKQLYAYVGLSGSSGEVADPRAIRDEIRAEMDQWRSEDTGSLHADYYLIAHDREASVSVERARQLGCPQLSAPQDGKVRCIVWGRAVIEQYLQDLSASDPRFVVPDDRQIGYELVEPDPQAKDQRPYWRTYFLDRAVRLTGSSIANAEGSFDPNTGTPIVLLDFNRAGARVFAELTGSIVGKKLATILDGRIKSAPIINGPIRGGRASITMGSGDRARQELERDELVHVLKTGSLPAPLRETSVRVIQ